MIIQINVFTAKVLRKLLTTALEIFSTLVITQYPNTIPTKLHECNLEPYHLFLLFLDKIANIFSCYIYIKKIPKGKYEMHSPVVFPRLGNILPLLESKSGVSGQVPSSSRLPFSCGEIVWSSRCCVKRIRRTSSAEKVSSSS